MSRPAFALTYGPCALVAGGSEGLGGAFAGELARRGVNLVLVARRPEPLAQTTHRPGLSWRPVNPTSLRRSISTAGRRPCSHTSSCPPWWNGARAG